MKYSFLPSSVLSFHFHSVIMIFFRSVCLFISGHETSVDFFYFSDWWGRWSNREQVSIRPRPLPLYCLWNRNRGATVFEISMHIYLSSKITCNCGWQKVGGGEGGCRVQLLTWDLQGSSPRWLSDRCPSRHTIITPNKQVALAWFVKSTSSQTMDAQSCMPTPSAQQGLSCSRTGKS